MKFLSSLSFCSAFIFCNVLLNAQFINIPDNAFKSALLQNPSINLNSDGEIDSTEANSFNGSIVVESLGINDLTGIEAFVNCTQLFCRFNSIGQLDLSALSSLQSLYCNNNAHLKFPSQV